MTVRNNSDSALSSFGEDGTGSFITEQCLNDLDLILHESFRQQRSPAPRDAKCAGINTAACQAQFKIKIVCDIYCASRLVSCTPRWSGSLVPVARDKYLLLSGRSGLNSYHIHLLYRLTA
jgi:hypothetical protein